MRTSDVKYVKLVYPLVDLKWSRGRCIEWLRSQDIPIPKKSACIGCPLHSNEAWFDLTDAEKADAIEFDEQIRNLQSHVDATAKPKKPVPGQIDLLDMDEVDDFAELNPLPRKQDTQLHLCKQGVPLKEFLAGTVEVQGELFNSEDNDCGGNCFI